MKNLLDIKTIVYLIIFSFTIIGIIYTASKTITLIDRNIDTLRSSVESLVIKVGQINSRGIGDHMLLKEVVSQQQKDEGEMAALAKQIDNIKISYETISRARMTSNIIKGDFRGVDERAQKNAQITNHTSGMVDAMIKGICPPENCNVQK